MQNLHVRSLKVLSDLAGKKLYTYVDVDDKTPVQKLSIADQLRVILKKITEDPANELKTEDAVTQEYLTLKSNLSEFIQKAVEPIKRGRHRSVVVRVSNAFDPVMKEVLSSRKITDYFTVEVARPDIEYDIPFDILVRFTVKSK